MACVKKGLSRQDAHEEIRTCLFFLTFEYRLTNPCL